MYFGCVLRFMRSASGSQPLLFYPEIERSCRANRKRRRARTRVVVEREDNQKTLRDYFKPVVQDNYLGIQHQTVNANNFELKLALINMVKHNQYGSLSSKNPNIHLAIFSGGV